MGAQGWAWGTKLAVRCPGFSGMSSNDIHVSQQTATSPSCFSIPTGYTVLLLPTSHLYHYWLHGKLERADWQKDGAVDQLLRSAKYVFRLAAAVRNEAALIYHFLTAVLLGQGSLKKNYRLPCKNTSYAHLPRSKWFWP